MSILDRFGQSLVAAFRTAAMQVFAQAKLRLSLFTKVLVMLHCLGNSAQETKTHYFGDGRSLAGDA